MKELPWWSPGEPTAAEDAVEGQGLAAVRPDQSSSRLDENDVARWIRSLPSSGLCTIGEAACVALGTKIEHGMSWPESPDIEFSFHSLCRLIRRGLAERGDASSGEGDLDIDESQIMVPATVAVEVACRFVEDWPAKPLLLLWAKKPAAVIGWLDGRYRLLAAESEWVQLCELEIAAAERAGIDRANEARLAEARACRRELEEAHKKLANYRHIVARMFLANAKREGARFADGWIQVGYADDFDKWLGKYIADAGAAGEAAPGQSVQALVDRYVKGERKSIEKDQALVHVGAALVELVGEQVVARDLKFVHDLLLRELAKQEKRKSHQVVPNTDDADLRGT